MADPFDKELSGIVAKAVGATGILQGEGVRLHENGTVVCIGKCSKYPLALFEDFCENMWEQGHSPFESFTAY